MLKALLAAMVMVESGGDCAAVGKAGERGPLQITRACYDDALEQARRPGTQGMYETLKDMGYEEAAHTLWSAKYIAKLYFKRYGGKSYPPNDKNSCKRLARIWNGGPSGNEKEATLGYWKKVRKELDRLAEKE